MSYKLLVTLLASIFSVASIAQADPSNSRKQKEEDFAKGRILVVPQAGLTNVEFDKILNEHGGKSRKFGQSNIHLVTIPGNSEKSVVEKLKKNPHIEIAELDRKIPISLVSNDPYLSSEYHLSLLGAAQAWDTTQGEGVTIAILDSGTDTTHPDLVANLVPGFNMVENNTNTTDVCGHGTAVAGSAAAVSNNAIGVASVAGGAKIMTIRIAYNDPNNGCYAYYSTIANGLTWAADNGAKIANISYAGVPSSLTIISSSNYFKSKGGLVFASAGNGGIDEGYTPTDSMIVVSATDQYEQRTSWSSFGNYVTLAAPGASIWSTSRGGSYQPWNGTSFSSPVAAGVGALVMSANPRLSNKEVQEILYSTSVDLGSLGKDIYYGYGRVSASAAVAAAKIAVPFADTQSPVVAITSPTAASTVSGVVPVSLTASDNIGVSSVQLFVNGNSVAIDSSDPFGFSWDSKGAANGMADIYVVAFDAAGNQAQSSTVSINVANQTAPIMKDTTAPVVTIVNPVAGNVTGTVNVSVNASDDSGAAGITQTLYIDNVQVKTARGSSLAYSWNTRKVNGGNHVLAVVVSDKAGNKSSTSVQVIKR